MKRIAPMALAAMLIVALGAASAPADSIWAKAHGRAGTRTVRLYEDDTAHAAGDLLTIIINERSVIDTEVKRENDKSSDRSLTASGNINLRDVGQWYGNRDGTFRLPDITTNSKAASAFKGNADFESDRSITDRVTVVVMDVLPNGNLVVLGTRHRDADGDNQVIEIGGVVRPSDITFANTVRSDQIADFRMTAKVKGPERHWTKPGWLGRILNWLSPW